jgi:membrane-associated protease RseP (regulator of RpoE activity)
MSEEIYDYGIGKKKNWFLGHNKVFLNILLFVATFITTTIAGTQWTGHFPFDITNWHYGLTYAILIMTFLTSHEMGHYIASRIHGIDATLPYFIPAPFPEMLFGTMGAVIKTRSPFPSKKALFDVGAAGPIAGFIVSLIILAIGFATLPPKEYIYTIHPEYLLNGGIVPETGLTFGNTLVFSVMSELFKNPDGWLPPMNEMYHYPFLCVGWFGLFVTTLNMLPLGQLDGGHIVYAMFGGDKQKIIARIAWYIILIIGLGALLAILLDFLQSVNYPNSFYISLQSNLIPLLTQLRTAVPLFFEGWGGWLFWALITRFFIKIPHPDMHFDDKLDSKRMLIGWATIIILLLSFTFKGIYEIH